MAIGRMELGAFTAFEKAQFDFVDGVNVFIGANASGKTHAMKALYAAVRACTDAPDRSIKDRLAERFARVFRPDEFSLGRLAHRSAGQKTFFVRIKSTDKKSSLGFSVYTRNGEVKVESADLEVTPAVFLPSREGLAMFEGFAAAYEKRELSFDATYFDLAISLSAAGLKGPRPPLLSEVIEKLEATVGGKIVTAGGRFYQRGAGGALLEAHLLSEGLRKLGSVVRLLQNGELREAGLFFWDEPEANLNPELAVLVAELIATLARGGVQIFLATHDYLLSETLALEAKKSEGPPTRFFCFRRGSANDGVSVTHADDLDDLDGNPIRAEFLRHYDRIRAGD